MKFKATKKEMKSRYNQIVGIGDSNLQFLLKFEEPIAYSTRSEGWACDYYDIDGILISTGYASLDSRNTKHDYNLVHGYDEQARDIMSDYDKSYEQQKEEVQQLLKQFIEEVTL